MECSAHYIECYALMSPFVLLKESDSLTELSSQNYQLNILGSIYTSQVNTWSSHAGFV